MELPKFIGFSFGVDELFSSARKQFENEERNRSLFANDTERYSSTSQSSFSEPKSGENGIGKGNVGRFSSLHGSFVGTAEGFDGSKKEGVRLRNSNVTLVSKNYSVNEDGVFGISEEIEEEGFIRGYDNKKIHRKKGTSRRPKLKGDPDWLPEEENLLSTSVSKRRRPIHFQNRKTPLMKDEGRDVSKRKTQNTADPSGLKNLLLSFGWMVVSQEGSSDPIYISPSGTIYRSLPKALEIFSRGASKFREKQCSSSQSVGSSSGNVDIRTQERDGVQRKTRIVTQPISENMVLSQQKIVEENEIEPSLHSVGMGCTEVHNAVAFGSVENQGKSCIQQECLNSGRKELDLSTVVVGLMAPNASNNTVTDIHQDDKFVVSGRPVHVNGEHVVSDRKFDNKIRVGEEITYIVKKPVNEEGNVKETVSIPEESRHGEVHEVMAVDKKLKSSTKDECLNHHNSADVHLNREYQRVRRSARINGRHVPVDDELDIEMWDGDFYFDSFDSGDILKPDNILGNEERDRKQKDKEGSPVPEKMRYREVHELLASCTPEEKAESCNSGDLFMQDMPAPQLEIDKRTGREPSPTPEEMIFGDVHQAMTSALDNEKRKSCTNYDCSYETKNLDSSNVINNDQTGDHQIHQDDELLGVRRSNRINGRHVPVDNEVDLEMWTCDAFMGVSGFLVNKVAIENKETAINTKVDKFSGESPVTGNMLYNQTSKKKFEYEHARNQKLLESNSSSFMHDNILKRCDGIENPVSEKCCSSSRKNVAKIMKPDKRSPSRSKKKSGGERYSNGKKNEKRSGGCGLIVRTEKCGLEEEPILSETKVTILSWLIDSGILSENAKVVYKIKKSKKITLRGWVTRGGVRCNCCKKVLSLLEFEVHAGSNLRQPWNNTFLSSGKSLMQCRSEAWEKEKQKSAVGFQMVGIGDADPSDDTCGICADGGILLCCDGCTSTFHQECLMLKSLPQGSWHCPFCSCAFCSWADHGEDKPDGMVSLLSCTQCGCKYHRDCVLEDDTEKMGPNSSSYCGKNCKKVAAGLSDLLGISNPIGEGLSWILVRRLDEVEDICSDQMQPLILECNSRLPLALWVLHECFIPLFDPRTGLDMTLQAVYNCGSNFNRLNYEGFYTVILEKDDEIISVATLRLRGTHLAEIPFIGTRPMYRRQGMCRRLLNAIEQMLSSLHVEKLIIPATPDMLETWIKSFSFQQLESSHKDEIRNFNMVVFADTTLLQKSIYYGRANKARDEEQLDVVDDLGQDTLNCYTVYEVTTLESCKDTKAPTSVNDTSRSMLSEVSNRSVFDDSPVQSPLVENKDMVVSSESWNEVSHCINISQYHSS